MLSQCSYHFARKCFVTVGVTLNMSALGLVFGFVAPLLKQLKLPQYSMPIDQEEGSWIAAFPGFFIFFGNLVVIPISGNYGRKTANLVSILLLIMAWTAIIFAPSIAVLLVARALQGINIGMCCTLGSLLIGEYTSPKNRGAFLTTVSVWAAIGVLSSHILGSYLSWRAGAIVCAIVALIDLSIVIFSPESPTWLASQGRYEECKRVFRWLRGDAEEDELEKMIETCRLIQISKVKEDISESIFAKLYKYVIYFGATIMKKEFYKPLIIVGHIYTLLMWSGVCVLVVSPEIYIRRLSGNNVDAALITTTLDVQRVLSNIFAIYIIKKSSRRAMLLVTASINIIALISIAVYIYARENYTLPFDHPMIGILLTHLMYLAIATGTSTLPLIIAGEIFPLHDKTLAGGIGMLVLSANFFVVIKTIPSRLAIFGIHGTFCINALILCYCLVVLWMMLPETKDKTLQDIEDEFRGRPLSQDLKPAHHDSSVFTVSDYEIPHLNDIYI